MPPAPDPTLACPRDRSQMVKVTRGEVVLDECGQCKGLWFDHKELRTVAHDGELEKRAAHLGKYAQQSPFGCPRCGGACYQSWVGEVQVDTCAACHGVWLDAHELEEARRQLETDRILGAARPGFRSFLRRL